MVIIGAVWHYLGIFYACIHEIISFVTDERANFIVFDLPLENEIKHFWEKRVSETLKLTFGPNYEFLPALSYIC